MKKLYVVYSEGEVGEVEGIFDEKENLLDFWSCDDASWRNEYFSGFMAKLGFEVKRPPVTLRDRLEKTLVKTCKDTWGL